MQDAKQPIILAVDDQPSNLHTVISILKPFYQVIALPSGAAMLKYLSIRSADLILLDHMMPEMTGIEALEKLQADSRLAGIPVLFLTGSEDDNTEVLALEMGAADYMHKPVKAQVLLTRIRLQLELVKYRNHMESLVEEKTQSIKQREEVALNLLAEATDMRDRDTGDHIIRTTEIVRILVMDLLKNPVAGYELSRQEAEDIIMSSKLHDLGKIAIPDKVLLKPGKLDKDELEIVRQHPLHGAMLLDKYNSQLADDRFLQTARDISLCHHERWDGKGYPKGISGKDIPLSARITALADVYDALISHRPYKEPFSHSSAIEIIIKDSGTHFDPYLVSVFVKNEQRINEICMAM